MLRYAITDSKHYGDNFALRKSSLVAQALRLAGEGVAYVQLREKDLETGDLLALATELAGVFLAAGGRTKLLVNARADVAVAASADGVHLTSHPDELTTQQVREIFALASMRDKPFISVSCHTLEDVECASTYGADLILFGPVFEKRLRQTVVSAGTGLAALQAACRAADGVPVLALGGVTTENTGDCVAAGASGVAGIRIFH